MGQIGEYLGKLLQAEALTIEQAEGLLDAVFEGDVPEAQVAAFLTAMRMKGVTAAELAGLARSLRKHAVAVKVDVGPLVDTCGTGGARVKSGNISTTAAFVAAGAGVYVAKHGNRGITSKCGSADVLEVLGVKIDAGLETVVACIEQARIGFLFAPMFHPAMRYVQPVRRSLGFRTVFNLLGPLANPAGVTAQVIGVAERELVGVVAEALRLLGTERAMVVHCNGLDEMGVAEVTDVVELCQGRIENKRIDASEFGMGRVSMEGLAVRDVQESAAVMRGILEGRVRGPRRDMVVLNAAAAIVVSGLAEDFGSAVAKAEAAIDGGGAMASLEKLLEISRDS